MPIRKHGPRPPRWKIKKIPYTGEYRIDVRRPPIGPERLPYILKVFSRDGKDKDGVGDACDKCPFTDLSKPIKVLYRNTWVDDRMYKDGCSLGESMLGMLKACINGGTSDPGGPETRQKRFKRCMSKELTKIVKSGIISWSERKKIFKKVKVTKESDLDKVCEDGTCPSTPTQPPTSTPSKICNGSDVLFVDRFDSETISSEWVAIEPRQWIENGWIHSQRGGGPRDSGAIVHTSNKSWADYSVSVTADFVDNGSPWDDFSIVVRADGYYRSSANNRGSGYEIAFRGWGTPGIYLVKKMYPKDARPGGQYTELLLHIPTQPSKMPMDIHISVVGAKIELWVDGVFVFDYVDTNPFLFGGIGFHCIWESQSRFDNFVVCRK